MSWMAWTLPSALFFVSIALALAVLTVAEILWPSQPRRGYLGLVSTRGDRFFITLLSSGFAHVLWLGLLDLPLWWASVLCVGWGFVVMRWG